MVCKLKKSLNGLKKSPKQWYKHFDSFMRGKIYTRSHYDPCVYYNKLPGGEYVYLLLYINDMLMLLEVDLQLINGRKACLWNLRRMISVK